MTNTATVIESTRTPLDLSPGQAAELSVLGRQLRSQMSWWGSPSDEIDERDRSVISVEPATGGGYWLEVRDAVGIVAVEDLEILVRPKIPVSHLLYLCSVAGALPRLDPQVAHLATSSTLWDLMARWFVSAAERVLRRGIVRDYEPIVSDEKELRSQVLPLPTSRLYYAGRFEFACSFDEFEIDSPLNRTLRAAALSVAASPRLVREIRRRAIRIADGLAVVGPLRPDDMNSTLDRRTMHYKDAFPLAIEILRSQHRTLMHGDRQAWSFLIRTPNVVEEGIRVLLRNELSPRVRVEKRGLRLAGSTLRFTPDVVFGSGLAVADIKYKLSRGDWNRPDLYQAVAFAEAFLSANAAIVRFRTENVPARDPITVGGISVADLCWVALDQWAPEEAATTLLEDARVWLGNLLESAEESA